MGVRWVIAGIITALLAGCGAEVLTTTAITGELQKRSAQSAMGVLKHVKGEAAELPVEQAIDMYYADKGYYPPLLQALVPEYLPSVPKKPDGGDYGYDPATGELFDQPIALTPADSRNMEQIRQAIIRYGQDTGYYPPSLEALTPYYLTEVPMTSSGQRFVYYPQDGALYHPAQLADLRSNAARARGEQAAPGSRPARRGVGGAPGPMGEVMTGIAMQEELNGMNTSGTAAASSRGRGSLKRTTDGYSQRQMDVVKELGF